MNKQQSLLLVKDGNILEQENINKKYEIGSQTKMFTAVSLFKLSEEFEGLMEITLKEAFKYDEDVINFISDLKNSNMKEGKDFSELKVKQLLNHTSHMPDMINWNDSNTEDEKILARFLEKYNQPTYSINEIKQIIETENLESLEALEKQDYSNTGYMLAGLLITYLSKSKSLAEAFTKLIFKPLNMNDTSMDSSDVDGYYKGELIKIYNSFYGAAGGIVSTPADMQIFMTQFFTKFNKIMKPETFDGWVEELKKSGPKGMGLYNTNDPAPTTVDFSKFVGHVGATFAAISLSTINLDRKEMIIIFTNEATDKEYLRDGLIKGINMFKEN